MRPEACTGTASVRLERCSGLVRSEGSASVCPAHRTSRSTLVPSQLLSHHTAMADRVQPHGRPPDPGTTRQEPPEYQAEMAPRSCPSATSISDTNLDGSQGGLPDQYQGSPGSGGIQYGLTRTSEDSQGLPNPTPYWGDQGLGLGLSATRLADKSSVEPHRVREARAERILRRRHFSQNYIV